MVEASKNKATRQLDKVGILQISQKEGLVLGHLSKELIMNLSQVITTQQGRESNH